jgi:seryl-tRNA synthetase
MLDLQAIRDDPERVRRGAARKGIAFDVDRALALDTERRRLTTLRDQARAEQNRLGKQVATLQGPAKQEALARLKTLKEEVERHASAALPVERELDALLLHAPNPPADDAPDGKSEAENVEVRRHGEPPTHGFRTRDHVELMTGLGMLDVERAGRIAGSRSYVLRGTASSSSRRSCGSAST